MELIQTDLKDAYLIRPQVFGDARGWFMESFQLDKLRSLGIAAPEFVQDNHSYSSRKGIVRGLHCQLAPHCQTKLIRCTKGEIDDVIVDIRQGSPTFLRWIKVKLTEENKLQLWIPKGFLHGFVTRTDEVEVQYKVDEYYDHALDRSVRFDDSVFGIDWDIRDPILSDKDQKAPLYRNSDVRFVYTI